MYADGEDFERHAPVRQKITQRSVKLPPSRAEATEENLENLPKAEGMIVGMFPGGVVIRSELGELLCGVAKTVRASKSSTALAVGDMATVGLTRPQHADESSLQDRDRSDGMVIARGLRKTALSRPQPRRGKRRDEFDDEVFEKVIVANMDVLLIVASAQEPPLRHGLIDRFLIIADRGELQAVLVINKIDIGQADPSVLADFASLGVEIIQCSAVTGEGLENLIKVLEGKRSVLAGASGVGKSTLINGILPGTNAVTNTVRDKDKRGRHTTTASVVYDLPAGGIIVDTPGLRELGLAMSASELPWYFPEFEQVAQQCKFRDCTHTHEPKCAVIAAVQVGDILPRRYAGYLNIRQTL